MPLQLQQLWTRGRDPCRTVALRQAMGKWRADQNSSAERPCSPADGGGKLNRSDRLNMATNLNTALSPGCREQQTCSPLARILAVEIVRAFYVSRDRGYPDCSPMWLDDDEAVTAIANIITPTLDKANAQAEP